MTESRSFPLIGDMIPDLTVQTTHGVKNLIDKRYKRQKKEAGS
jgi:hypothetical protein